MEPWADERSDEAAGTLVATVIAAHGGQPKASEETMRYLKRPEAPQSEDEMKAVIGAVNRTLNPAP
jgi:hypothetical protein